MYVKMFFRETLPLIALGVALGGGHIVLREYGPLGLLVTSVCAGIAYMLLRDAIRRSQREIDQAAQKPDIDDLVRKILEDHTRLDADEALPESLRLMNWTIERSDSNEVRVGLMFGDTSAWQR